MILYNRPNVDLTFKAPEEVESERTENCRFRQPHCRLTPTSHAGKPREYPHKRETTVIGLQLRV